MDANGFIAAFVAGLVLGNVTRHLSMSLLDFSEEEGQLLVLLTFMIFGGAFVGPALDEFTWRIALYAVLSLVVVRSIPVAVSLFGMRFHLDTLAFLGWFGPRRLASIVFGLLVLEEMDVAGRQEIFLIVTWTILLSVIAHGLTAQPFASWYGTRPTQWLRNQECRRWWRSRNCQRALACVRSARLRTRSDEEN